MRIGVNTLFLIPGEVGGTETYLREVLLAMARTFGDVEWVLFTNSENDGHLRRIFGEFPRFSFHRLPLRASNRYARILREQIDLPFRVAASRADILWSPGYTAPFFALCPQAVTIHDMQYKRHPEDLSFLARLATDILVRTAAARCRRIIAVSDFSKREIIRFAKTDPEKIAVVYEAADPAFSRPVPEDTRRQRLKGLLASGKPYILCIANTYPHKNVHTLIAAFGRILDQIPHELVLLGKPRLGEPEVQRALSMVSDPSRIQRLSQVDREDLVSLYQGAALFVFPSLYEGFGLPVLEAMMSGVPVLTTRCGAIPEVGGDRVQYFEPSRSSDLAEKIVHMVSWEADHRNHSVNEAQKRAHRYSWEQTASGTMECLRKLMKSNG